MHTGHIIRSSGLSRVFGVWDVDGTVKELPQEDVIACESDDEPLVVESMGVIGGLCDADRLACGGDLIRARI